MPEQNSVPPDCGADPDVALDRVIDPGERLRHRGRPDQHHGLELFKTEFVTRHDLLASHDLNERRVDPEDSGAGRVRDFPKQPAIGETRMPVVEHRHAVHQRAPHQGVPHHPARCGIKEQRVALAEFEMEGGGFVMLQHDPVVAMHDRFGQTGRAGRKQDPQRMIGGHTLEDKGAGVDVGALQHLFPG